MRGRTWSVVVLAAVLLGVGMAGSEMARAYRFLEANKELVIFGKGEQWKPRWDPAVWSPRTTLEVAVSEDPLWVTLDAFENQREVRDLVRTALARWSGIGAADIRWKLTDGPVEGSPVSFGLWPDEVPRWQYPGRTNVGGYRSGYFVCEIWIDPDQSARFSRAVMLWMFTHELGHCLGLDHHPAFPNDRVPRLPAGEDKSRWGESGVMAVAGGFDLVHTERVGASLLRPARGWLATTGGIYGTVLNSDLESERRQANLLFGRVGFDGVPRDAVNRLTDRRGRFVVEGLAPGTYVVMMHGGLLREAGTVREAVRLQTVEVRAGERTGPLILTARRWAEAE